MQIWKKVISLLLCMAMVLSCVPNVWAADDMGVVGGTVQTAYIKVESEADFTTGSYVMMVSSGYAAGVFESGWITAAQPTVSGDEVVDTAGAVWTLTVDGSTVKLTDANGVTVKPKSGNNNGIQSGDYSWNWSFADGTFQFKGAGSDTTTLASNAASGYDYTNKFRAYKNTTVSGNTKTYLADFTLYKQVEIIGGGTDTPVVPEVTEPAIRETAISVSADKTVLHPGDEFTVTVSISGDVPFTSVGYVPEQESVYFEVLSGVVLSGGQSADMADYQLGSGGVIYFENATTVNDDIFSVTMRVREDAPVGAFEATAKFEGVQVRNVDDYVPFSLTEPTFTVSAAEPADGTLLSIVDAIKLGASMEHNTYTSNKMMVTGVISEVYNTTYGNMRLTDESGNILTIYGTYSADGSTRYDKLATKPVAGDTVTIYGILGQYNNVPQIKNGWIVEHIAVEPQPTEPTVEPTEPADGTELSIADAIKLGSAMAHNTYTTNKVKVTGVITEVYNIHYGNMRLTDENGNILTIYGTYSADGSDRYDAMDPKPMAGDTVTIYGVLGQYNGTPQIKNGWVVNHIPREPAPTVAPTEPVVTEPTQPTEPGAGSVILDLGYQKNRVSYATDAVIYQANGITLTNRKATSTTNMRDNADDDHLRVYKSSEVEIEHPNMTKVVFTCTTESYATVAAESMSALGTATVDGTVVTLELATLSDSFRYAATNQHRFTQVEIFSLGGSETEPTEPVAPTEPSEPVVTEPVDYTAYCPHCDQNVVWTDWNGGMPASGHYRLVSDLTMESISIIGSANSQVDVILDLNGHTMTTLKRAFTVNNGGTLTLLDTSFEGSGTIQSNMTTGAGGIAYIATGAVTVLSGNYIGATASQGGLFMIPTITCSLNIYGGKFIGAKVTGNGGIIAANKGMVSIYGGSFVPGVAGGKGDSIYIGTAASVFIDEAPYIGGGVYLGVDAKLSLRGAPVIRADESSYGVMVEGSLIDVGVLEEGAAISVTANGVFTNPFASVDDAAMASWYFTCDDPSKVILTSSSGLEVADPIVGPPMPTDPVVTEPVVTEPTVAPTAKTYCAFGHTSHEGVRCEAELINWTAWDKADSLPAEGSYYLIQDITIKDTWKPSDLNLDLAGYNITRTVEQGDSDDCNVFTVVTGKSFLLTDTNVEKEGVLSVAWEGETFPGATGKLGKVVKVGVNATMQMYGGIIDGSNINYHSSFTTNAAVTVENSSGGNDAKFYMYGGKIIGIQNSSSNGSALLSRNGTTVELHGGEIVAGTGKTTTGNAVYPGNGNLVIGDVKVTGTVYLSGDLTRVTVKGAPEIERLILGSSSTNAFDATALESGASIGINNSRSDKSVAFATVDEDLTACFTSLNAGYEIVYNANGTLAMAEAAQPTEPVVTEPVVTEPTVAPTVPEVTEPVVTEPTEPSEPSGRTAYCPHCDQYVQWTAWDGYKPTENIHLYLAEDMSFYATTIIGVNGANSDVVLDLNGHVINSSSRTFTVSYNATFSVMDSVGTGAICSTAGGTGGMFQTSKGTINIYSGDYRLDSADVKHGGLFYLTGASSQLNIYGGNFTGGAITGSGGIMQINNASANILGGTFIPGKAANQGDSIYVTGASAQVTIGGNAFIMGGVQVYTGKLTLTGSPVIVAKSSEYGLKVSGTPIAVEGLTEGAQISVTADGIFTDPFSSVDDAAAVMQYFSCDDFSKVIIIQDNALAVVDSVIEPTEPSEPETEPTEPPTEPTQPSLPPEDADVTFYVIPEYSEVQQGDTLSVLVRVESKVPVSSLGYNHILSSDVFEFISGEVLASGMLCEYSKEGGVIAFSSANVLSADVFRLTVRIKEDAPVGYAYFTDSVAANNSAQHLSTTVVESGVRVVCKDHAFSDWTAYSDYEHQHYCPKCDKTEYLPHDWNDGVIIKDPSCYEYGEMVYTCVTCGYSRYETIEPSYNHVYGGWEDQYDGTHKRFCVQDGCWSYEHYGHNWDGGMVTIAPTCYQSGIRTYTCWDCGAQYEEYIDPTYEHVYGEWVDQYDGTHKRACLQDGCWSYEHYGHMWDGGVETLAPTCIHNGIMTYTCLDCGALWEDTIWPTYIHSFGDWISVDEYAHKHVCTVEGCGAVEQWGHMWDGGTIIQQPTCVNTGTIAYTCMDCGHARYDTLWPTYMHIYTEKTPVDGFLHSWGCETCDEVWHGDHYLQEGNCHECGYVAVYTVIFRDWDGRIISENTYGYGETVAVPADPFRAADSAYVYEFAGWNREILTQCTNNATYTAQYDIVAIRADFDSDGIVTDDDAYYLLRHILFADAYPVIQDGDLNGDGVATDADALYLLRYVLFGPERYPLVHDEVQEWA